MPSDLTPTTARIGTLARWAPAPIGLVFAIAVALPHGVHLGQAVLFVLAALWSVLLPGLVVLRLCRDQARSLLEEVTVGFVVGLMAQIVAWGIFVALGIGSYLALYPVPLIALVLLTPRLRGRLRTTTYRERQPWWGAWGLAVAYGWATLTLATHVFAGNPLPPARTRWYPDLYWHVAVAASARTSAPPLVPQVSGQTLNYHWFAHAHMAADSLVSGVDVLVVASRLWYLPVYAAVLTLTYLLAFRLAGTAKAGLIALVMILFNASVTPIRWLHAQGVDAIVPLSPSEIMGLPVLLLTTWWLIEIVRGSRPSRAGWLLLVLMAITCAGSKSSNLPVLVCGLLLVGVVQLVIKRRQARTWIALAICVGSIVVTAPFLLGGSNVSKLAFLAEPGQQLGFMFEPDQIRGDAWRYTFLVVLSLLTLIQLAGLLLVLPLCADPAVVLMLGIVVAGFSALLLVFHPSLSELYFLRGVMPLSDVLIAWGLVHAAQAARARWWHVGVAFLAGGVAFQYARRLTGTEHPSPNPALRTIIVVTAITLLLLGAGAVLWRWDRVHPGRFSLRAILAGMLVGAAVLPTTVANTRGVFPNYDVNAPKNLLSPGAVAGTTWLRTHTPEDTLLATNVHCRKGPTRRICDARALWVTALSERRAYVESWGYTDQAYATANNPRPGEVGVFYWRASFYDQERLKINDAAFNGPTPYVLRTLYDRGVRYLIGDTAASPVSPKLATMAQQVFHSGDVTVYRLRRP